MTIITGFHAIEESLRSVAARSGELYLTGNSPRQQRLAETARAVGAQVHYVDLSELDGIAENRDHRGAAYLLKSESQPKIADLAAVLPSISGTDALVLVLDQVTDPHNLGAILRSADKFAVDLVVLPTRRSAHINETVATVSAGASVYLQIAVAPNLTRACTQMKKAGFWIYGADINGTTICDVDLRGRTALVLGSEGKGLSRLVRESCDNLVRIPSAGHVDSFNVSVAAGICMYEIRRQQGLHP